MYCIKCGSQIPDGSTYCTRCGAAQNAAVRSSTETPADVREESKFFGTLGALGGALLGAACIIILSQLNFISSISGFVLAGCTLMGYSHFGKGLSLYGMILCILLMLVTPYIADRMDWAIVVIKEFSDVSFGDAFRAIPYLISEGAIEEDLYLKNLLMVYLFTAIGGIGTAIQLLKGRKNKRSAP